MAVLHWNRPSAWVVLWTGVVVGVFVVRGDLRLGDAAAPSPVAIAATQPTAPVSVTAKAKPRAVARRDVACRVFDTLGQPVVGASARASDGVVTAADGDGAFALALAPGEARDVLVSAPGRAPTWLRVSEGSPDAHVVQLEPAAPWDADAADRAPLPQPVRIGEGVLRDAQGQPLAHAFVGVAGAALWARTDEHGRFAVPMPAGEAALVACADGDSQGAGAFAAATALATPAASARVPLADLHATAANAVRGVLRDSRGEPLAGAFVAVEAAGLRRVVATDAGGAFRVGCLPPGPCRIAPLPWRGALAAAREVALDGRGVDVDLQLALAEPARVRVVDEQGAAVPGAFVAATVDGLRRGVVRADADGYASVPWRADARFDVRFGERLAPLPVRRFEPEPAQLVVGMP
jgi:hypothetical protein